MPKQNENLGENENMSQNFDQELLAIYKKFSNKIKPKDNKPSLKPKKRELVEPTKKNK